MVSLQMDPTKVREIVDNMMLKESKQLDRLTNDRSVQQIQLSVNSKLRNLMDTLQTNLSNITTAFATVGYSAASSNTDYVTVSATNNKLTPGAHTLTINTLAVAQSNLAAKSYSSKDTAAGINETLTFTNTLTSDAFSVSIGIDDSLETIADNINQNPDNIDVTATVVTKVNGSTTASYLKIVANNTGTASAYSITGDTASGFNFAGGTTVSAVNANFDFDGMNNISYSNTVTEVISGLEFNLLAADSGVENTITIVEDNTSRIAAVKDKIQAWMNTYNDIMETIDGSRANQYTRMNSLLFIKSKFQNVISQEYDVSGSIKYLASMGIQNADIEKKLDVSDPKKPISYYVEGKLEFAPDDKVNSFSKITSTNFNDLVKFFTTTTNGFIDASWNDLDQSLNYNDAQSSQGILLITDEQLNGSIADLSRDIDAESDRLEKVKMNLLLKWGRLNGNLARYDSLSDALGKQLGYLDSLLRK